MCSPDNLPTRTAFDMCRTMQLGDGVFSGQGRGADVHIVQMRAPPACTAAPGDGHIIEFLHNATGNVICPWSPATPSEYG
jgi:hypothetical protein